MALDHEWYADNDSKKLEEIEFQGKSLIYFIARSIFYKPH